MFTSKLDDSLKFRNGLVEIRRLQNRHGCFNIVVLLMMILRTILSVYDHVFVK